MYLIKSKLIEKSPGLLTGPARFGGIVIDDSVEDDRDATILDKMLMLIATNVLSY